ncbi:hypothetical protein [Sagittula sp.]|uniref:hypothetical protein n=1 Tax=Sagittula sp. TaxID=2038081 RepID=UPI0035118223
MVLPARTVAQGNPPASDHQVDQKELADWMEYIERLGLGEIGYFEDDLADLPAASGVTDGAFAVVLTDATEANRGIYQEQSDAWVKTADLPPSYQAAADILDARDEAQTSATEAATSETNAIIARGAAETARDQALAAASLAGTTIYEDTTAGLAATSDTEYFLAYEGPGLARFLNNAGVADLDLWISRVFFDDFAAFDAFPGALPAGITLRTWRGGFTYVTVASGEDFTTTGGLKVQVVVDGADQFCARSCGVTPGVGVDNTAGITACVAVMNRIRQVANSGGPPTCILPRGVIEANVEITLTESMAFIGQGFAIGADGTPDTESTGTWLVLQSYGSMFYSGEPTGGTARAARNVQLRNFTLTRGLDYRNTAHEDYDGTAGLIHGHGAAKWILRDLQLGAGPTPAIHLTEPWDCHGMNITITHSGQPDGLSAFTTINSGATSQDGNSNRWHDIRIEDSEGPALETEGNHNHFDDVKIHAPANSLGSNAMPAVRLGKNSIITKGQFANFTVAAKGNTSALVQFDGEGASLSNSVFRSNGGVQIIQVIGTDINAGGGYISNNRYDFEMSGTYLIQDDRTGNGRPLILGTEECGSYSGAAATVAGANQNGALFLGGPPPTGYRPGVYSYKSIGSGGAAIHARMANVNAADPYAFAGLFQSGNLGNAVGCFEQMRTSGNVAEVLRLATGLLANTGKKMLRVVVDNQGTPTEVMNIGIDGSINIGAFTATQIADISHTVNTTGKAAGKIVRDSTNNRLMMSEGAGAASAWWVIDGSSSVTPA